MSGKITHLQLKQQLTPHVDNEDDLMAILRQFRHQQLVRMPGHNFSNSVDIHPVRSNN